MNDGSPTIPVQIQFQGTWFLIDAKVEVYLDGENLGKFSIKNGFNIDKEILPGKHMISTKIPIRGSKQFPFEVSKDTSIITLSYSRMWGNFSEIEIDSASGAIVTPLLEKDLQQKVVNIEQTVVHGDYIDDRDTIVKDSVLNRSNIGGGSSKAEELQRVADLKEKGLIDDDEFKQMKKEILGK